MSQFISLRILASIGLGGLARSKSTSNRETPAAPSVAERPAGVRGAEREEPSSASRISVGRMRVVP
jgi:hypothetical protein